MNHNLGVTTTRNSFFSAGLHAITYCRRISSLSKINQLINIITTKISFLFFWRISKENKWLSHVNKSLSSQYKFSILLQIQISKYRYKLFSYLNYLMNLVACLKVKEIAIGGDSYY